MKELTYKFVENETELKGAFAVRRQVFVEEQGVAGELEFDKDDREALHMVVKDGQGVVGTARVLFFTDNQAKLERIAVLKLLRRRGIGRGIISFLDEELQNRGVEQVILHAQCVAAAFYRACGFAETGSTFWEVGIKHIKMQKHLSKA